MKENLHILISHPPFHYSVSALPSQVVGHLQHLIRRLDGFGVNLISPLRGNHIHHLFNHFHIGHFQHSLGNGTHTVQPRSAKLRLARSSGSSEQVLSEEIGRASCRERV